MKGLVNEYLVTLFCQKSKQILYRSGFFLLENIPKDGYFHNFIPIWMAKLRFFSNFATEFVLKISFLL